MTTSLVALLGKRETPTDGVEDYCHFLADALGRRGIAMETVRVDWDHLGWIGALRKIWKQGDKWSGSWVVVHYTALSWSCRGFPLGLLFVLAGLRRRGVRCAVLFHEPTRQPGRSRLRDSIRGKVQDWVIRRSFRAAEKAIFTVPVDLIAWLPAGSAKACYIPIGANIPGRGSSRAQDAADDGDFKTVAVFCITPGENRFLEIGDLALAAGHVARSAGKVRFIVMGKGSGEARVEIEAALRDKGVDVRVLGIVPAEKVADSLAGADVLLYLTGWVAQNRSSVLAGVACGLPIVGYAGGPHEPIHDAGVQMVPYRDGEALAGALVRVLNDATLRSELRRKSEMAQQQHFSWDSIASRYARAFDLGEQVVSPMRAPVIQGDRSIQENK